MCREINKTLDYRRYGYLGDPLPRRSCLGLRASTSRGHAGLVSRELRCPYWMVVGWAYSYLVMPPPPAASNWSTSGHLVLVRRSIGGCPKWKVWNALLGAFVEWVRYTRPAYKPISKVWFFVPRFKVFSCHFEFFLDEVLKLEHYL